MRHHNPPLCVLIRSEIGCGEGVLLGARAVRNLCVEHKNVGVAPVVAVPAVVAAVHREGIPPLPVAVVLLIAVRWEEPLVLDGGPKGLEEALVEVRVGGGKVRVGSPEDG